MALSYTQLIRFDLLSEIESSLEINGIDMLMKFFALQQEINIVDRLIREMPSFPHSNKQIFRNELVSAIGSTLAIEGISLEREEIDEVLQEPDLKHKIEKKQQEALNSRNVYNYVKKEIDNCEGDFIFTIDHICKIHEYFTDGIEYPGNYPGRFRNTGAIFGDPKKKSLCGNYEDIFVAMKGFVEWLNRAETGPWSGNAVAKAIMAHYYLTEIHPFGDGNGRMARAVEAMVLYANKINSYCFWSLANYWCVNRTEYITRLGDMRQTCNPCDFILWGSEGFLGEINRTKTLVLKKVKQLMFRDYVSWYYAGNKDRPVKKRIKQRNVNVLVLLARFGKIKLEKLRSDPAYKAYYSNLASPVQTANRDIDKMKSLVLIRITSSGDAEYIEPNYEIFNPLEYQV